MSLGRDYEGFCAESTPFDGMAFAPDASITLEQGVRGYPAAPDMNSYSSHFHEAEHPQPDWNPQLEDVASTTTSLMPSLERDSNACVDSLDPLSAIWGGGQPYRYSVPY